MDRKLKSFEHGDTFVTLESCNGEYIVSLYLNGIASRELNPPKNAEFRSTTLDAALEVYHETCKHAQRLES